ncbi:hypothetical protein EW026_g4459 [Hermanssonia centrifuga]|uniref:Uncharacterized protein n=1 Tax=Hermanssonia centrifuga TaxID=98765 RepID=A0A4S4KH16_9APHY|nr:hypothetical protein EW026_g4459 [Hermanssonia centrifuga]
MRAIQVGSTAAAAGGIFQFIPSNITAANGTTVTFMWSGAPGNHSVTQSSLDSPCQPLPNGFDSGFVFIPTPATSGIPSWNLTITNDQEPIYFYCGQLVPAPGHCPLGMVGTINAPTTGNASWEAFWETAMGTAATTPGTPIPNLSGRCFRGWASYSLRGKLRSPTKFECYLGLDVPFTYNKRECSSAFVGKWDHCDDRRAVRNCPDVEHSVGTI